MVTTSHQILSEYVANRIGIRYLYFTSMNAGFTHYTLYGWGWGTVFSPSLVTIPEATTLTQLSLSLITRQFLPPILVRVWKIEVLRQSSFSLGLARAHLTTLRWQVILSTSSIDGECMLKTHLNVAAWSTSKSSSQTSPSGSWMISSKLSWSLFDWVSIINVLDLLGHCTETWSYPQHLKHWVCWMNLDSSPAISLPLSSRLGLELLGPKRDRDWDGLGDI